MRNGTRLWPPKWWYVGPVAKQKENILLAGTVALFISAPFLLSSSRQERIRSADRAIMSYIGAHRAGKTATPLDVLTLRNATAYTLRKRERAPDIYVFMDPYQVPFAAISYDHPQLSLRDFNVHLLPLPALAPDARTYKRAVALGLLNLPEYDLHGLDSSAIDAWNRNPPRVIDSTINKVWDNLTRDQHRKIEEAWAVNQKAHMENPEYPVFVVTEDHAYKFKNLETVKELVVPMKKLAE